MSKYGSESEDDPDPFEDSGEEWNEQKVAKTGNRRQSTRLSKKPRQFVQDSDSEDAVDEDDDEFQVEDEEDDDDEPKAKRVKNGVSIKTEIKKVEKTDDDEDKTEKDNVTVVSNNARTLHRKFIPKTITCQNFSTGSFVINKKDAQKGDPKVQPCIWRIDGKALLQKYEPFEEEGKRRHKNTSIYTGWSPMDADIYAPITVDVISHQNHNLTVEVHWDELKKIDYDSE